VRAWAAWSVAVLFVLYLFGFQTGYSAVNASIQNDLGLSVVQLGAIAATYTWSFAIVQLFGGALLDRLGARRVLLPAIAAFTAGVFVFASGRSFAGLILAQIILALGACVGFVGAGYVGGKWFGMAKFSFMFGLVQCAASLFSAVNQNLLSFAVGRLDWRTLCVWSGVLGIAIFVVALAFLRDPDPVPAPNKISVTSLLREVCASLVQVAKSAHVWVAAAFGALSFGTLLAAGVVWAPKLMLARGLPADVAGLSASVLWLGVAIGCIVIPWWSDAVARRKLPAAAGIALQLAALVALVYLPQLAPPVAITCWLIFGFGAAAHMLAFSAAGDVVKLELIGTSAAIVNGTMFLVSGLLIARPGQLAERFASSTTIDVAHRAMLPLELGLVLALIMLALMRESHPRRV
jgi:MFS family permease